MKMFDFHMDQPVTDRDFVTIVCETLGLAESAVAVIRSLDEIDARQTVSVYVLRTLHGGQFAHSFEVLPTNSIKEADLPSELDLATRLVGRLHCRCLIGDNSPNPYSWTLVSPGVLPQTVSVDVDGFGNHERLTIVEPPAGGDGNLRHSRDVVCMKMNDRKQILLRLLAALAFGAAALGVVHTLTFVWLTSAHRDNIRGYVPTGLTGMIFLGIATLVLLFRLAAVARRRRSSVAPYVAVGCLAAPTAVIGFSVYTSLLIPFIGEYSWQKDVTMSAIGGGVCTVMAIVFYRLWLSKRADNKSIHGIGDSTPNHDA